MGLAFDDFPLVGAERLVLVHGFTQNRRCWGPLLTALRRRFHVIAVDAPGHGNTPPQHDDATMGQAAELIAGIGGQATYLGYSMGGRLCLQLACQHPELVQRLVLVGATPGLSSPRLRAERRHADERLAARLEQVGLAAFVDEWLALPLFAGLTPQTAHRSERLDNRPEGLAASLRHCGTGSQRPLWPLLHRLTMPVLAVVGATDAKFRPVAAEIVRTINGRAEPTAPPITTGNASVALVAEAGHTAHLERPDPFLATLVTWLDEHPMS